MPLLLLAGLTLCVAAAIAVAIVRTVSDNSPDRALLPPPLRSTPLHLVTAQEHCRPSPDHRLRPICSEAFQFRVRAAQMTVDSSAVVHALVSAGWHLVCPTSPGPRALQPPENLTMALVAADPKDAGLLDVNLISVPGPASCGR